jgi:hypothetical protein
MAQRDPFGRLPDENPLAGLGWLSDGVESQHAAQPVASGRSTADAGDERWRGGSDADAPDQRWRGGSKAADESWRSDADVVTPAAPAKPARLSAATAAQQATLRDLLGAVQGMKSARPGAAPRGPQVVDDVRRVVKAFAVLAIVVALVSVVAGVLVTGPSVKDGASKIAVPSTDLGRSPNGGAVPVGLAKGSLLLRRNLAPALRRMRTSGMGRLRSLAIRPERIDAQLLTKDGRLRSVQQGVDGRLRELSTSGGGFAGVPTIPFTRANSAAPARLARSAAGRLKRPASRVDYVVLVNSGPTAVWTVVMKGGGQFLGDARGRITRRIG